MRIKMVLFTIIWQPTLIDLATMKYEDLLFANKTIVRFTHLHTVRQRMRDARENVCQHSMRIILTSASWRNKKPITICINWRNSQVFISDDLCILQMAFTESEKLAKAL